MNKKVMQSDKNSTNTRTDTNIHNQRKLQALERKALLLKHNTTQHNMKSNGHVCLISPGDATVVQPLLSSHDDVESSAKVIRLHIHDLCQHVWSLGIKHVAAFFFFMHSVNTIGFLPVIISENKDKHYVYI